MSDEFVVKDPPLLQADVDLLRHAADRLPLSQARLLLDPPLGDNAARTRRERMHELFGVRGNEFDWVVLEAMRRKAIPIPDWLYGADLAPELNGKQRKALNKLVSVAREDAPVISARQQVGQELLYEAMSVVRKAYPEMTPSLSQARVAWVYWAQTPRGLAIRAKQLEQREEG